MTIPVLVLLGFAGWTLLLLVSTVGIYRWSMILSGRATIREWTPDEPQGNALYRRAMRAHMNCVENLPLYGAVVLAIVATGVGSPLLDWLALTLLGARVIQSLLHVAVEPTEFIAGTRFLFFFVQIVCMTGMGVYTVLHA